MSRRWSDVDNGDFQFFKLIEIPFSPFQSDGEEYEYRAVRRKNGSSSRQEYLRSFTFSRKQTLRDRVKSRLGRLKAAVCAVVASNYYYCLPRRIRKLKEKLVLKSLRCPRKRSPLLQGTCFQG